MSYQIKKVLVNNSLIKVTASFHDGLYENNYEFPSSVTQLEVLSALDSGEILYKTSQQMRDDLPQSLKDLVGYTKA